jgi:hypothetical protein
MLRKPETPEERIEFIFKGIDAYDPDTGTILGRSYGRRMTGRPPRWYVYPGPDAENRDRFRFSLAAWSLDEAIEAANARMKKILEKEARNARR